MVFDIFSKRAKRRSGEGNDVYQYEAIPPEAKAQIVHLWQRSIGDGSDYSGSSRSYSKMCDILREEYGVFHLYPDEQYSGGINEFVKFFLSEKSIVRCLDAIELSMKCVEQGLRDHHEPESEAVISILNTRLREAGVGYQYDSGQIVRVDSQFIHSEVVKPALHFLEDPEFRGANEEFLKAHQEYRHGDYEQCLGEALKSLESVMKIIAHKRKWNLQGETASKLIAAVFENNLIPPYLQTQFSALRATLESGVPTARNKESGHGQGVTTRNVPEHLASYVLHQTAAAILFLIQAHKAAK